MEGLLDGTPALDLVALPSEKSVIVLLDPPEGRAAVRNLVCVGPDAQIAWRAELPTTGEADAFVSFELADGGQIAASTWSGYWVLISPDSGPLIGQRFTK